MKAGTMWEGRRNFKEDFFFVFFRFLDERVGGSWGGKEREREKGTETHRNQPRPSERRSMQ
jgi:hypothetical protein